MRLYAATSNPGKLDEFTHAAHPHGIEVLALPNIKSMPEPEETASTFLGNAEIKAIAYSLTQPGELVVADDSGLEVGALGGQPGVRSARFADDVKFAPNSPLSKDERNNLCLLSLLAALPNPDCTARFVCVLAVARDGKILHRAEGFVTGEILRAPRGTDGFGYDPLFLIPDLNRTLAEIPQEQKWLLSHRGNAFRNLLRQLHA
jgi:XTP/dITP diphosphohydrolase